MFFAGGALSAGPEIEVPWLPFIIVSLVLVATSFEAYFSVVEADGDVVFYEVAWLDRVKIFSFAKDVARVTAQGPWLVHRRYEHPPTQATVTTARPPGSQVSGDLAKLTSLAEMRSRGLISDADYDAKKQEILARL